MVFAEARKNKGQCDQIQSVRKFLALKHKLEAESTQLGTVVTATPIAN